MKRLVLLVIIGACMAAEKQIGLEDIERDNLISEKQIKHPGVQASHQPQPFIPSQQIPVRHQPQQLVVPRQYILAHPQYQIQYVPQHQPQPQQRVIYVQSPIIKQPPVQYVMLVNPNEAYKNQHVQNGIHHDPHNSQHTHNLVGLLQRNAYTNSVSNNFRPPLPPPQPVPQQQPPTPHQLYSFRPGPGTPLPFVVQQYAIPGITYAHPRQGSQDGQQAQQSVATVALAPAVRQPTSLLDSYVPSVLQLQYYRQLQEAQPSNYVLSLQSPPRNIQQSDHF